MTDCLFCSIVAGSTTAYRVLDTPHAVGFLDIRPLIKGHVLVVPRDHVPTLTDLPAAQVGDYFQTVQRVTMAVESAMSAAGTFIAINNKVSQSVPHLHVHVVPRNRGDGLRGFFWPRTKYADDAEATEYAGRIRAALADLEHADPPGR